MKRTFSLVAAVLVTSALLAGGASAQTHYVRYSQNGGDISWGVLDGSTIHQLSDAPYLDATRTGQSVQRSSVKLEAPVDPKLVFMTAFNFRSHISGEPAVAAPGGVSGLGGGKPSRSRLRLIGLSSTRESFKCRSRSSSMRTVRQR